ncbi:glycosyltransferase family 39 protein [Actinomadura rudentiformis]|uniref:Glycosyltransferase RgtA/B/C/D-like domain-containing protein n=1 Tax=Actinomadura rudentiformis TaxID=359158 RepID=A0A6H9YKV2_9ACTN|nr:glycosyltransferase family 39 protein [Actinomadura rudentiformis]KAB2347858.1 hypothetical protein F8566_18380 [Actinomadura rudentiformis]
MSAESLAPDNPTLAGPSAGDSEGGGDAESAEARGRSRSWLLPVGPVALALVLGVAGINGPSYWLDEAATVTVSGRPMPDMFRVFDNLDLVHALYYLIMRPWVVLFGTGESALRLPSVLAIAAATAGVVGIGRRCSGPLAGLLAGLVFAGNVAVSRHAHEARSYAMVAAVAVLATYLLVRATEEGAERRGRWFTAYGLTIVVVGLLNLDAVLLLPAHLVTLWLARARMAGLWRSWLMSAGAATVALVPFALFAQTQSNQVNWLPAPSGRMIWKLLEFLAGDTWLVAPMLALAVLGAVVGRQGRGALPLTAVAVPWLILPPALLLIVSALAEPMFMFRYVFFCLPGLALLAGVALARLATLARPAKAVGPLAVVTATGLLAGLSVPAHLAERRQDSRLDDLRAAADIVRANARDGDGIVYLAGVVRWGALAYPDAFGRLKDISLREGPVRAGNIKGRDRLPREMRPGLVRLNRVWVMGSRSLLPEHAETVMRRQEVVMASGPWRVAGQWKYWGGLLTLYERTGPYREANAPVGRAT